ncbi:MAG: right-handed parallel beta-helix repeat-containing protein [Acidobacteria bacterium]|nr:right-handed parallel beta-helix repeat-containing protein [Acidobacteriota bacterium]
MGGKRRRAPVAQAADPLVHGAVIEAAAHTVASYDEPEPNAWDQYQDFGHSHWHNSLIWGEGLDDVSIAGPGLIHGKGLVRVNDAPKGAGNKAISLKNSRNVTIRDVSILHGGHFAILATGVDNLTIDNVRIDTNRDGIDVDACRNVRISNATINSPFDDGICLKSSFGLGVARATENVTITNCQVSGYDEGSLLDGTFKRAVSYTRGPTGRIKFGTESNGGFKNITIANCVFDYSRGLAIESVDGGRIEDVSITNLTMRDIVNAPIFVRLGHRARGPNNPPAGVIRRVHINNVVASNVDASYGVLLSGIPGHPIEDLRLSGIRIAYRGGGTKADAALELPEKEDAYPEPDMFGRTPSYGLYARHVTSFGVHDAVFTVDQPDARPAVQLEDVAGADLDNLSLQRAPGSPLFVLRQVRDFLLRNSPALPDTRRREVARESF